MSKRMAMNFQEFLRARKEWPADCFFEPEELLLSDKALEKGLENLPSPAEWEMMKRFARCILKSLRLLWGAPLIVSSGFRDPRVNKLAGGTETSDHLFQIGGAADLRPLMPTAAAVREFFRVVAENALEGKRGPSFDQLILYPDRVHVGWRPAGNRLQIMRAVAKPGGGWTWPVITTEDLRLET